MTAKHRNDVVNVSLGDISGRVRRIARRLGVSSPDVVRMAIRSGLPPESGADPEARKEDEEQAEIARKALALAS